ncbi:uncharacterized protein HMPREF1541_04124 [Cyphellophora europaea CBS 101466]|uniref:Uncharacterized protein n=1 Tax=Cyphellophora europaea (strain CBS 101466) TaxID=1220924 RepID=W2S2A6_CYPE1|nr:uncharacterized protein HMPREF1541_04124 [Cyphellophora europaea CBS 101466]ETN42183.1 hypothetical protein HMPREF1541_04124 [Cyphellophora europaea CBS 101466]
MSQRPSKRRRLSEEPSALDRHTVSYSRSAPATPRRSYQSPTKASLQRAHPHLVRSNKPSQPSQDHRRLLEHVLSGATDPKDTDSTNNTAPADQSEDAAAALSPGHILKGWARNAGGGSQQRGLSLSHELQDEHDSGYAGVPRLVKSSQSRRRQFSLSSDEGDSALPPTSVQLGRDPPPERPKGISTSSSPRGPRSGGGRHSSRLRNSESVTSSPLKPKSRNSRAYQMAKGDEARELADKAPKNAPNGDNNHDKADDEQDVPNEIKEKEDILKALRNQQQTLLASSKTLETAVDTESIAQAVERDASFINLIKSAGMACTLQEPCFDYKPARVPMDRQLLHLNLFAPGALVLSTKTSVRLVSGHTKVFHRVKVSAPPPWPPHTFSAIFEIVTDPENIIVERISYIDDRQAEGVSNELYLWIKHRLAHDLLRTDLAGLIWGLGEYFSAAVDRAKALLAVRREYVEDADQDDEGGISTVQTRKLTGHQALALSHHITDTSITIDLPSSEPESNSQRSTRQTDRFSPKVLASWRIALTPISEATSMLEIIPSGVPDSTAQAATSLFAKLAKVDNFETAFTAVWGILTGEQSTIAAAEAGTNASSQAGSQAEGKGLGKRRKKRRKIT